MKRTLLFAALLFVGIHLFAQGGFRIGIKGGVNGTMLYNKNWLNDDAVNYGIGVGAVGGLSLGYDAVFYNYGLNLEFDFKQYNTKINEDRPSPSWEYNYKLNYLSMPVFFRLRPQGNKFTRTYTNGGAYFEIGVAPELVMSAHLSYKYLDTVKNSNVTEQIPNAKDQFEGFHLAAVLGLGFHQFGTDQWSVTHGLRFSYGILDINSSAGEKGKEYTDFKTGDKKAYKPTKAFSAGYLLSIIYKFQRGGKGGTRK